jgi:hypothetical protein
LYYKYVSYWMTNCIFMVTVTKMISTSARLYTLDRIYGKRNEINKKIKN